MRQIGTLPATTDPKVLGDYLLSQGVTTRAVESKDGWSFWVHNEDHLPQAVEAFRAYEADPGDPRFADASGAADAARRHAEALDRRYRKNVRNLSGSWDNLNARRRPLTLLLVLLCVGVFVAEQVSPEVEAWLEDHLLFFPLALLDRRHDVSHSLDAIRQGQVWRLITPIFLHGGLVHLVFNVWATLIEGTIIETRRGTRAILVLVLVSAVGSNLGQYAYMLAVHQRLIPWVGISGVGYALFGYLWMKGRFEPEQGVVLHPSTVRVMLLWLLLGFTGLLPMANGAHVAGLVVGMLFGLARF